MSTLHELRAILKIAKSVPCKDCGNQYHHAVMDADHRIPEDRSFSLSRPPVGTTSEEFLAELAKCDIICSNCHRMRTFNSGGFFKAKQRKTMGIVLAGSEHPSY